jgi:hypothetical protein
VSNASGRKYGRWASHFDPYSPIYSRRERAEVMLSDFALGAVASGLLGLAKAFGWLWLLKVLHPPANGFPLCSLPAVLPVCAGSSCSLAHGAAICWHSWLL